MKRVSALATTRPATILEATGPQISDFPPSPTASENRPAMVVVVVIRIGITRLRAAYTVACSGRMPALMRELAASIRTIALFTAIPVSAMIP